MKSTSILLAVFVAGCVSTPPSTDVAASVPELRPGIPAGYLGNQVPNSVLLLPRPPAEDSAAFKQDQDVSRNSQQLRGTPRYALAASDADLSFPHAAGTFECALGIPITEQQTPRLYLLLRRVMIDAALATYGAKNEYKRTRPFVHYNEGTCTPADEAKLRNDGSYPSGHTAAGWAWALVLTELAPERADAVLARGRAFGESRLVCNAHWQSDVLEGRAAAAGAVARLHADAIFRSEMDAARKEIDALRMQGAGLERDCAGEAAALQIRINGVL